MSTAWQRGRIIDRQGRVLFFSGLEPLGFWMRLRGLIGRPALRRQQAWWFSRCRSVHGIGLRHPLDLVYLDQAGTILRITALRPGTISWHRKAGQVIELRSGAARQAALKVGQTLRFQP